MSTITALQLSNYVKQKLVEIDVLAIGTSEQHSAFIAKQLAIVETKCVSVWGEALGKAICTAWKDDIFTENMSARYMDDGRLSNYHNVAHVCTMLQRYFDWVRKHGDSFGVSRADYGQGMLAIMYHDISHSHGALSDIQNVARAIHCFTGLCVARFQPIGMMLGKEGQWMPGYSFLCNVASTLMDLGVERGKVSELIAAHFDVTKQTTATYFDDICKAIQYTQFPHLEGDVFTSLPSHLEIIRMLDMSSSASDDWFQQIYEGLFLEMARGEERSGVEFVNFCVNQYQFITRLDDGYKYPSTMTERAIAALLIARNGLNKLEGQGNGTVSA